ncbi:MAG: UPF0158 family protein [Carboxylicivirga sp.]|jgi:hypothetical protein|nr:UPF0158 family protein [Carboxylicivirga sp.]
MKNTSELIERIIALLKDDYSIYIQRNNARLVAIPNSERIMEFMDFADMEDETMFMQVEEHPDDFFKIEPLTSREEFNIMMDFSDEQERVESLQLVKALRTNRPLELFKKEINKIGVTMLSSWQQYYSDRLKGILRSRLCREHIHLLRENCQ